MALRCTSGRRTAALTAFGAVAVTGVATAVAVFAPSAGATAPQTYPLPKTGSVTITGNGNGHGHGLSQYGAQGMASAEGTTAKAIVAFYYPGTVRRTISPRTTIRVRISSAGGDTCVQAVPGITLTGVAGTLSLAGGVKRFRLAPSGSGLILQRNTRNSCGAGWTTARTGLPARADFHSPRGYVRNYHPNASSTALRGTVGAVRQGRGEITINRVGLDSYTEGVVPREMPASWHVAAIHAQAIAARSYVEYAREHPLAGTYDICDSSQCQVYGGMTEYGPNGAVLWRDDPASINAYQGQVLTYHGATAFTQFSASNGGWSVAGGEPYLVAKADPHDTRALGDPYVGWARKVAVATIAKAYRLATVTKIVVTKRDGHGQWGGRILTATVYGTTAAKKATTVKTTGPDLQDALNLPQNWFTIGR